MDEREDIQTEQKGRSCPVGYGVESGVPIIGLGLLLILFALVPYLIGTGAMPIPIAVIIAAGGLFMIWAGLYR
ncbi:MAG: hypothetical protein LUQ25_05690 [Methanoregulaceae archaeon]|nr:hypothetical protein [Methanoregulaceae archaeon]